MTELEKLLHKSIAQVEAKKAGDQALRERRPRFRRYKARHALKALEKAMQ